MFMRYILLITIFCTNLLFASTQTGLDWLQSQLNSDNNYSTNTIVASKIQSLSEAKIALQLFDKSIPSYLLKQINTVEDNSTEYLGRKIVANINNNKNVDNLVNELYSHINEDGSFSDYSGYSVGTILDTAYALYALKIANSTHDISKSFQYLSRQQNTLGFYRDENTHDTLGRYESRNDINYISSVVLKSLYLYSNNLAIQEMIAKLHSYFISDSQLDTSELTTVANTVIALSAKVLVENKTLLTTVETILDPQNDNNSWNNDIYTTSLVLQALKKIDDMQTITTLSSLKGRLLDADTLEPLVGRTIFFNSQWVYTDENGNFLITNISAGNYTLSTDASSYRGTKRKILFNSSEVVNLGNVKLSKFSDEDSSIHILGKVTDKNLQPLQEATIIVDNIVTTTDNNGSYHLYLPKYNYTRHFTAYAHLDGYITKQVSSYLWGGQNFIFSPQLEQGTQVSSQVTIESSGEANTTLQGIVTDHITGLPINGVTVYIDNNSTTTDRNGIYSFTNIKTDKINIHTKHTDYNPQITSINVTTGDKVIFSPSLTKFSKATITGMIRDAQTDEIVSDVNVTLYNTSSTLSNNDGSYALTEINQGTYNIQFTKQGYDTVTLVVPIETGDTLILTPSFYKKGETPDYVNSASLTGQVLNSTSGLALANIPVKITEEDKETVIVTDNDGKFFIEGIHSDKINAYVRVDGYQETTVIANIVPLSQNNMGNIRLRPDNVSNTASDLLFIDANMSDFSSDELYQNINTTLTFKLRNKGNSNVTQDINVLAYYDTNRNLRYDANSDTFIALKTIENGLNIDAELTETLTVQTKQPFRDAPISLYVDHADDIVEIYGTNNNFIVTKSCNEPYSIASDLEPIVKWRWDATTTPNNPTFQNAYSSPVVVRIQDDNNDSVINELDTPAVVFQTSQDRNASILRAVDGKTGKELWTNSEVLLQHAIGVAAGDIDNDGIVEIISVTYDGYLCAFENTGKLKWISSDKVIVSHANISLADIDSDGNVEIVISVYVFDSEGNLLWKDEAGYKGAHNGVKLGVPDFTRFTTSSVADLDNDGFSEIIVGSSVYDYLGNKLWYAKDPISNYGLGDGYTAVGNFDDDEEAEIVVVVDNYTYLLEHTGEIIWGPINVKGGAPSIGDFDGNGEPEIVITDNNVITVVNSDGSIRWQREVTDGSSGITSTSIFDFNGDGKVEIIYADEEKLRIFDGTTSEVLYTIHNSSGTGTELPLIVDVDNDNEAEIVFVGNNYGFQPYTPGITVLESNSSNWMPTRSIWNQNSYHITNINNDGTIPQHEEASWLKDNSYRLNKTFENSAQKADVSIKQLNGIFNQYVVRVGNASSKSLRSTTLNFYDGVVSEDNLLQTQQLVNIKPNSYLDFEFNTTNETTNTIIAVVTLDNNSTDCDPSNNSVEMLYIPNINASVITTQDSNSTNDTIYFTTIIKNESVITTNFEVIISIKDSNNNLVTQFASEVINDLDANTDSTIHTQWNVPNILAGTYTFEVLVQEPSFGNIILKNSMQFDVLTNFSEVDGSDLEVSLSSNLDKQEYIVNENLSTEVIIQNLTNNKIIYNTILIVEITDESGTVFDTKTLELNQLLPTSVRQIFLDFDITYSKYNNKEGKFFLVSKVISDVEIATNSKVFEVQKPQVNTINLSTSMSFNAKYTSDKLSCNTSIQNTVENQINDFEVRHYIYNSDTEKVVLDEENIFTLEGYKYDSFNSEIPSDQLVNGNYTCLTLIKRDDTWVNNSTNDIDVNVDNLKLVDTSSYLSYSGQYEDELLQCTTQVTNRTTTAFSDLNIKHAIVNTDSNTTVLENIQSLSLNVDERQTVKSEMLPKGLPSAIYSCITYVEQKGEWKQYNESVRDINTDNLKVAKVYNALNYEATFKSDPLTCNSQIRNRSNGAVLNLKNIIANEEAFESLLTDEFSLTFENEYSQYKQTNLTLDTLNSGRYSCQTLVEVDGEWIEYAKSYIDLVIDIDSLISDNFTTNFKLKGTTQQKLLIMLDDANSSRWIRGKHRKSHIGDDPFGPYSSPTLITQQLHLEALLKQENINYTIVTNEYEFVKALRTFNYTSIALFNEYENLSLQTTSEIREAVVRGTGLLYASNYQFWAQGLEKPLGVDFKLYNHKKATTVIDLDSTYSNNNIALSFSDYTPSVRAIDAEVIANFESERGYFNFHRQQKFPAITYNSYFNSKTVFIGFDILMQASVEDDDNPNTQLLDEILVDALQRIDVVRTADVQTVAQGQTYTAEFSVTNTDTNESLDLAVLAIAQEAQLEVLEQGDLVNDFGMSFIMINDLIQSNNTNTYLYNFRVDDNATEVNISNYIAFDLQHSDIFQEMAFYPEIFSKVFDVIPDNISSNTTPNVITSDETSNHTFQEVLEETQSIGKWHLRRVQTYLKWAIYYEQRNTKADDNYALVLSLIASDYLSGMRESEDINTAHFKLAHAIKNLIVKIEQRTQEETN
jgi:hypothetical protein